MIGLVKVPYTNTYYFDNSFWIRADAVKQYNYYLNKWFNPTTELTKEEISKAVSQIIQNRNKK